MTPTCPSQASTSTSPQSPETPARLPREHGPKRRLAWAVLLPLLFYVAALNPHFIPATYDNITYYFGADSIARQGTFSMHGQPIVDWPPAFSMLLAVPVLAGLQSVLTAKIVVILCAAVALLLCFRLWRQEGREQPVLTLWIFALLPAAHTMGTRIMAEWPFIMMSMLFLLALRNIAQKNRGWPAAAGCGLLLGAASLTKFVGVLLGAAVIGQMASRWRAKKSGRVPKPRIVEPLVAALGAAVFTLWNAKVNWQIRNGMAPESDYYREGWISERLIHIDPVGTLQKISELLFHAASIGRYLGMDGLALGVVLVLPGVLVIIGTIELIRSKRMHPSDGYVLSLLVLFSTLNDNQQVRYLLPAAPFLIQYFLVGCNRVSELARPARAWWGSWGFRGLTAAWLLLLAASAAHLVFLGNIQKTHGGLFYFASPTPESFYRGFWLDYYRACRQIRNDPLPGSVATTGNADDKYVMAFSGRDWVKFGPDTGFTFLLELEGTALTEEQKGWLHLVPVSRVNSVTVYQRAPGF